MSMYVDASALLRLVLREPGGVDALRNSPALVASELIAVEAPRSLDRLRLKGFLTVEESAAAARFVADWLESVDLVLLRPRVLSLAAEPLAVPLGTVDAVHLASARVWRDRTGDRLTFVTHDEALALAARAYGFEVEGA